MRMDVERPRCARDPLVDAIALFLARDHAQGLGEIRIMLEQAIDEAGPGAVDRLGSRLASAGRTGTTRRAIPWRVASIASSPHASCSTSQW